jgi:hypothetical protein
MELVELVVLFPVLTETIAVPALEILSTLNP